MERMRSRSTADGASGSYITRKDALEPMETDPTDNQTKIANAGASTMVTAFTKAESYKRVRADGECQAEERWWWLSSTTRPLSRKS